MSKHPASRKTAARFATPVASATAVSGRNSSPTALDTIQLNTHPAANGSKPSDDENNAKTDTITVGAGLKLIGEALLGLCSMPIRTCRYLSDCRCCSTRVEDGGCLCCLPPAVLCCMCMWRSATLFWFLSALLMVVGWWIWIYGLVWSSYYLIETTRNAASIVNVTEQLPFVVHQHFPMQWYHMFPGILITVAYFVRICMQAVVQQQQRHEPIPSFSDELLPVCDVQKAQMFTVVVCAGSGFMMCLLWVALIASFGNLPTPQIDENGSVTYLTAANAFAVPAVTILLQCTLLLMALFCSYWAQHISSHSQQQQHDLEMLSFTRE